MWQTNISASNAHHATGLLHVSSLFLAELGRIILCYVAVLPDGQMRG